MTKYFMAITYDLCEHQHLCEEMNTYILDSSTSMDTQVQAFANTDIAPLVKVYTSTTPVFIEMSLYTSYTFKEYECRCNQ